MNRKLDEKWLKFKKCVFGFYYLFNKTPRVLVVSGIDAGSQYCHQEARNFLSWCFSMLWVLALLTTSWLQDDCHCTRHHTYAQCKRWKLLQHGHVCPLYSSEQKPPQNIPLDICLYFIVQNYVTSVLLTTKEDAKVSIELGTSPTQHKWHLLVRKMAERIAAASVVSD